MKFRTKSVLNLPLEKRIRYLATLPTITTRSRARSSPITWSTQRPMMAAFLDSLGIAHENGLITEETVVKPDAAKLTAAAEEL